MRLNTKLIAILTCLAGLTSCTVDDATYTEYDHHVYYDHPMRHYHQSYYSVEQPAEATTVYQSHVNSYPTYQGSQTPPAPDTTGSQTPPAPM